MSEGLTPKEVAEALGVQPRTVRRMAEAYEAVFGDLPRVRSGDNSPRFWPQNALCRIQVAYQALQAGRVTSLYQGLVLVRDGVDLPEKLELLSGQTADSLSAVIIGLKQYLEYQQEEITMLRTMVERQDRELASISSEQWELKLRQIVREESQKAFDPERLRCVVHSMGSSEKKETSWLSYFRALWKRY